MSAINFTKTVLRNLFSKPATRLYPYVKREYPARTRGQIGIDIDACIFCGICSKKCPTGAIAVDRAAKSWSIRRFGCIQCGECTSVCPKKCLTMLNDYTVPGPEKTEDRFVQIPKEAPAASEAAAAPKAPAVPEAPTEPAKGGEKE